MAQTTLPTDEKLQYERMIEAYRKELAKKTEENRELVVKVDRLESEIARLR